MSTTPTRVFVARLVGLPIFDPHIHMTSRTTDDYQAMAAAGLLSPDATVIVLTGLGLRLFDMQSNGAPAAAIIARGSWRSRRIVCQ